MNKAVIAVDHRNVEVKYYPTKRKNILCISVVRDAGANRTAFPGFEFASHEAYMQDRLRDSIGTNIRRNWAIKGWALVTQEVFDMMLAAV